MDTTRSVMVTGRLVLPDGIASSRHGAVVLNCGIELANSISAMSDLRGEFRIRVSTASGLESDRLSRQAAMQCSISVAIPGFETVLKNMQNLNLKAGADVGMIVLKPLSNAEGPASASPA